jgi:hypothetical protein
VGRGACCIAAAAGAAPGWRTFATVDIDGPRSPCPAITTSARGGTTVVGGVPGAGGAGAGAGAGRASCWTAGRATGTRRRISSAGTDMAIPFLVPIVYRSGASPDHVTDEEHARDMLLLLETLAEKFMADMADAASWDSTCAVVLWTSIIMLVSWMFS